MRRPSLLKTAFSLDPAKRILLYSGVVQHYMIYSYYVTVFRVLEVFRNTASKLDPRLTVNPARFPGDSRKHSGLVRAWKTLLGDLTLQKLRQKGSGGASKD